MSDQSKCKQCGKQTLNAVLQMYDGLCRRCFREPQVPPSNSHGRPGNTKSLSPRSVRRIIGVIVAIAGVALVALGLWIIEASDEVTGGFLTLVPNGMFFLGAFAFFGGIYTLVTGRIARIPSKEETEAAYRAQSWPRRLVPVFILWAGIGVGLLVVHFGFEAMGYEEPDYPGAGALGALGGLIVALFFELHSFSVD